MEPGNHGVIAPGFNPKETPEQFVDKIMRNRKRMEYTIKKYEDEQYKKPKPSKSLLPKSTPEVEIQAPKSNPAVDAA